MCARALTETHIHILLENNFLIAITLSTNILVKMFVLLFVYLSITILQLRPWNVDTLCKEKESKTVSRASLFFFIGFYLL